MPQNVFVTVSHYITKVNTVIEQLVPGLSIELRSIAQQVMKDGSVGQMAEVIARRNGTELPLRMNQTESAA